MRLLTAGESHGYGNVAILEGFPCGVAIEESFINQELKRRMSGFGRGKRMAIEDDRAELISGLRNKVTLGSPIALMIKNKDHRIFTQSPDNLPALTVPRPSHADLVGSLKYYNSDVRNILERASARETVAKVACGAICKQLLSNFNINFASFTISVGKICSSKKPNSIKEIIAATNRSQLNCIDSQKEKLMIKEIEKAAQDKDSLGGVVEVWIDGVCPGIGSVMHFDRRLDAILSLYLMSIPAVKGVEIGLGFEYSHCRGSKTHDEIYYSKDKGFFHKTNNSGGIEGGMSTGETIVLRLAMKPIATLLSPLESVDITTKKKAKAIIERSDTCAISALGVIAENMAAIAITTSFLEKFGCDSLKDIKANYKNYLQGINK